MGYRYRDVDRWYQVCWYWNHKPDQKIRPECSKMKCDSATTGDNCTANSQRQRRPDEFGTYVLESYVYVRRNSKEVKLIKSSVICYHYKWLRCSFS